MASRGGKERSEKEAQEGGGICIHKADFTSLYSRNLLNIVKQLYSNNKEYYKDPNTENKCMDTKEKRRHGMSWEIGIETMYKIEN